MSSSGAVVCTSICASGRATMPTTSPSRGSAIAFISPTTPTIVNHGRVPSTPADALADRRLVRPKAFRDALTDDANERGVGAIALEEIATLQQRLADALEVSGHGHTRVCRENASWLGSGCTFRVEQHQRPRCVHRRWRNDGGGFDTGQCAQLCERALERVLFGGRGGEESIWNRDVEGKAILGFEAPWLFDELSEKLGRGDTRGQKRRGDGELDDDEGAQQTARVAVEGCAARGNANRSAQIGARSARGRQQTKTQANECHHAGGEGEDWQIESCGVIELAHRAAGRICAFRTKREKHRCRPRRNEQTECGSDRSQEKRLDELLPNELSSARAQGSTQRKLPFAFNHAREQQAGEIRRRDQE